uniref:Uncharacterized protein n=1 Tax=Romanomermis culicivorax TaxID=13658 RepID=A0A915JSQ8_ROMCU
MSSFRTSPIQLLF